jgi:AraC family transcriptional activator of mtrCDE
MMKEPVMSIPALDKLLAAVSVELDAFAVCEIARDAQMVIPPLASIEVHFVLSGLLHLSIDGVWTTLPAGSVVIVPPGRSQWLAGSRSATREMPSRAICSVRPDLLNLYDAADGGAGHVRVMCGQMTTGMAGCYGPFDDMPHPLAADLGKTALVTSAFATMLGEIDAPGPYSRTLTGALMKACLVLLVRRHVAEHGTAGLPGLFRKPWLAQVVSSILEEPAADHSVASLAAASGRSRTIFAKDFTDQIGTPPMAFVTQARLTHARNMLVGSDSPIGQIAAKSGFASRSHFSRLFREVHGTDPSSYRRRHAADASTHAD